MAGGFLSLCVLAVLSGYLQAQEISEHDLYVTQSWRSDSRAVVVRAQGEPHLTVQTCPPLYLRQFASILTIMHRMYIWCALTLDNSPFSVALCVCVCVCPQYSWMMHSLTEWLVALC